MKLLKRILIILLCITAMLVDVFMVDRYGWNWADYVQIELTPLAQ